MTQFEKITESPETLGAFLAALPVIHEPWDTEFQARFCADCLYLGCDTCPHEEFCQRQSEIVRKRRRNFVIFGRGGVTNSSVSLLKKCVYNLLLLDSVVNK